MAGSTAARSWEQKLARLDRRWVYLGLFIFTLVPLLLNLNLPVYVTPPVQSFYDTIESLPADRFVVISSNWDAGTYAENEPQTIAIFRHLLRRRLKFVFMAAGQPNAPQLTQNALTQALQLEYPGGIPPGEYPQYGRDYINAGFKVRNTPWVRSFVGDPVAAWSADWKGRPIAEMPLLAGSGRLPDRASCLIDITGSATIDAWVSLVGSEGLRIQLACTAVMAPEQYPLLATGQLTGMLTGMRGAAEYEKLLGAESRATRMMGGQSFAHLYLFFLIGLGNVAVVRGYLARRHRR